MLLSDKEIAQRCSEEDMISPFEPNQINTLPAPGKSMLAIHKSIPLPNAALKAVSFGCGSYGYDVRTSGDFQIFSNALVPDGVIDPKNFDERFLLHRRVRQGESILIPPNSFALTSSMEWINVPRDIMVICIGKSTYARCGIIINVTPLEPEWRGNITIEISNTCPLPARIYSGEGIAQLIFLRASEICETSYADRKGKYQNQKGVTVAKV